MKPGVRAVGGRRVASGFTLLEAIVALVVFTMGAFALYGWLSTNIITLERVRERQEIEAVVHSALDIVRRTNPMETPEGQRRLGDLVVVWSSASVEPIKPSVDQSGFPGPYDVGLYDSTVRVLREDRELHVFHVRQLGWKRVRSGGDF